MRGRECEAAGQTQRKRFEAGVQAVRGCDAVIKRGGSSWPQAEPCVRILDCLFNCQLQNGSLSNVEKVSLMFVGLKGGGRLIVN